MPSFQLTRTLEVANLTQAGYDALLNELNAGYANPGDLLEGIAEALDEDAAQQLEENGRCDLETFLEWGIEDLGPDEGNP